MPLFRWITRLLSAAVRQPPKTDPHVRLSLTRLEERRVLNADVSLVGSQLQLADFSYETEQPGGATSSWGGGGGPIAAAETSTIDHDAPQDLFDLVVANAAQNQDVVHTTVKDSAELHAFLTMVQTLPAQDAPVTIVAGLAEGSYSGLNLSLPSNVALVIDGQGGGVTIVGASPALEVTAGQVIVQNGVTFSVSSDDPTIVVQPGGSLTLTDTIVNESDGFSQSAIFVHAGGGLDLSSGDNTLNVRGDGQLITWQDSAALSIVGNTLQVDGSDLDASELADNFEIEDRITHALDNGTFGRVTWVADSVYVTASTLGIQTGIDVADAGDTVHVAAGTYIHTGQIDVDKSVTIVGAGQDETIIQRSGQATGKELRTVQVNAPDVTFQGLTFGGWTDAPADANVGLGYLVWLDSPADRTTFDDVRFDGNDIRVAIYAGTRNDLTVTNSRFTGSYFRAAIRGAGERMLISHNSFEESHYWYSPIHMEYGAPTSGEISFNYFAHRVGVNNQEYGDFKSDGTGLWAITNWQPNTTTSDGLYIVHNTFHFQDSDLVNELGNQPIPEAIHIDPLLPASGPIVIRDNIFQGYKYTGPQAATEPQWLPGGGVFGGALEFDGDGDFGVFQSPLFDIGEKGSMTLWINVDTLGKRHMLAGGAVEHQLRHTNDLYFYPGNLGSNNTLIWSSDTVSRNTWTHVAYTWDHSLQEGRIFINGTEVNYRGGYDPNVSPFWTQILDTVDKLILVGRDPGNPGLRDFAGKMDDLAWFNDVLTIGEIQSIRDLGVAAAAGTDSNLVAHWDFDQTSGNIAVDNKNGIEMHIVTNGIVPFGPEFRPGMGQFGGALEFDGKDDFATFKDPSFDVGEKGTISFWVKMDNTGRRNQFLEGPENAGFEVQYRTNSGGQVYGRVTTDGDFVIRSGPDATTLNGNWTNVQIIYDFNGLPAADGGGRLRIYLNGVESGYLAGFTPTDLSWSGVVSTVNELMNIGRDPGDASRFFDGMMDDFAWFNDVLNAAERAEIRGTAVGDSSLSGDARLVAYWNFDDATGTTVVPSNGGTSIPLFLQAEPPAPPIQGFAINAPAGTVVSNNVFFDNDVNFNPLVDDLGNNIIADPVFNLGTIPGEHPYQIAFGSVAAYASTEYQLDCFTDTPHIGAYQGNPGLFASGDLVVNGSCGDDLLIIDATDPDNVTITFTWDLGGPNELTLSPIPWTNPTGVIFNGKLGDDHFVIINPSDGVFTLDNGIVFHGGTGGEGSPQGNPEGDRLEIIGGTAATVEHDFTNASDGFIGYDGTFAISYTELERIVDTSEADHRIFSLPDSDNPDVTLQDHSDAGQMEFSGSTFVDLTFANPSVSLTIDGGEMADTVAVASVDPDFRASLIIDGRDGDDAITLEADLTLGSSTSDGNLTLTAEAIDVSASSIDTAGDTDAGSVIFNGPVTLSNHLVINTDHPSGTDGNVGFHRTLDSTPGDGHGLTITAGTGNVTFWDAVGSATNASLGAILIGTAADVTVASTIDAASLAQDGGTGTTQLNGQVTTTAPGTNFRLNTAVIDVNADVVTNGGNVDLDATTLVDLDAAATVATTSDTAGGAGGAVDINALGTASVLLSGAIVTTGASGIGVGGAGGAVTIATSDGPIAVGDITASGGAGTGPAGGLGGSIHLTSGDADNNNAHAITLNGTLTTLGGAGTPAGADGTVRLDADGAIVDGNGAGMANIVAGTAELTAAEGIGDGPNEDDAIDVQVGVLDAVNTGPGHIRILQLAAGGDVAVVRLEQRSPTDSGSILLRAENGSITVVADQSGVTTAGSGNILLETQDAGSNVVINSQIVATVGHVSVVAAQDVTQGAGGDVLAGGTLDVEAQSGSITMADGARGTATGNVRYLAAQNVTLGGVSGENVRIEATAGSILDGGDADKDVTAEEVQLVAGVSIGAPGAGAIDTAVGTLAASAGSGSIYVSEADGLTVGEVDAIEVNRVQMDSMSPPQAGEALADAVAAMNVKIEAGMEAAGDLTVDNDVTATTGHISLVASNDVWINADVMTNGGSADNAEGTIEIRAGVKISLKEGVVIKTGTGQMKGAAGMVNPPPPILVVVFPVDQGGSNVNSLGVGYIDVTVNDPGVVNYQITVDWGDRTVLTYRPEDAFSGGDDFVSENTYRLRYAYQADNIPDPNNPSAPIPVKVTIRYDGREVADTHGGFVRGIVFREGGAELSTMVETELTVPGTGLFGFIKVTESVIVPVELRPTTPVLYVLSEVAPAVRQEELFALQAAAADQASIGAMRIFFRRVDAAGKEGPDVELPADAFDRGLDNLFRKFPNGHYRVYLQEANSQRIRLIREIHVYQGRIVPADFRDDVMERQPGSASDERPNDPASEPPVDSPADPADDQPADSTNGEQNGTGAAGAAALAAWSTRRRIERVDRALEQAGKTGTKFGRRRRRVSNEQQI